MATRKTVKTVEKKINNLDVMTDGKFSYHKQSDGTYLQVGSVTKRTIEMWFAYGYILKPLEV